MQPGARRPSELARPAVVVVVALIVVQPSCHQSIWRHRLQAPAASHRGVVGHVLVGGRLVVLLLLLLHHDLVV